MNVTNFVHQKILMDHIKHVLNNPFHSPARRSEIKAQLTSKYPNIELEDSMSVSAQEARPKVEEKKKMDSSTKKMENKKSSKSRRRSFDTVVWQSISNLRTREASSSAAADRLREGALSQEPKKQKPPKNPATRRARHSFDKDEEPFSSSNAMVSNAQLARNKALQYGNLALEFDTLTTNLRTLQHEYLNTFKAVLNCEVASILFLNDRTRELLLYSDSNIWYRIPSGTGVVGYCAETGQSLNIPDAYSDWRFNSNLDIRTGFKTRNILCQPIRTMRGGGAVIGVVQMLNKKDNEDFDLQDEQALANCAQKIAEDMNERFKDLLLVADKFSGNAIFVGSKGGDPLKKPLALHESHTANTRRNSKPRNEGKLPEI